MPYFVIPGRAVLLGKQPDGDSVRFVPDDPSLLSRLRFGDRVRISADGSVQLRFDGIDAPELHYQAAAQPQGGAARGALLQHLGFTSVQFGGDGETVSATTPGSVPLVILAEMAEINGRPVSIVFTGDAAIHLLPSAGQQIELTTALLGDSVNLWEVGTGTAYPLLYTSTAPQLRAVFRNAAAGARSRAAGVWSADSTASFPLTTVDALGPEGALIWPKLFRRAVDYLRLRGPDQTLADWLESTPANDDEIYVGSGEFPVALHTLIQQVGDLAHLTSDPLDLTVVER